MRAFYYVNSIECHSIKLDFHSIIFILACIQIKKIPGATNTEGNHDDAVLAQLCGSLCSACAVLRYAPYAADLIRQLSSVFPESD